MDYQIPTELIFAAVSLVIYAIGLKMLTSVVFKRVTVSSTYVTLTKKDILMILLYFTLFFSGIALAVSFIPVKTTIVRFSETILRLLVALMALASGYAGVKYDLSEEFA